MLSVNERNLIDARILIRSRRVVGKLKDRFANSTRPILRKRPILTVCFPKILAGAKAFEISDIQEHETEAGANEATRRSEANNDTFV